MENVFIIKSFFVVPIVILGAIVSFWVLLSDKKAKANRFLFININFIIFSLLFDYLSGFIGEPASTYMIRLSYTFLVFAVATFYYFVQYFPFYTKNYKSLNTLITIPTLLIGIITIFSSAVVKSINLESWGNQVVLGDYIWLYYFFIVSVIIISSINLVYKYRKSTNADRRKIRFMVIGIMLYIFTQLIFNLFLPLMDIQNYYYLGDYSIVVFMIFTTYAIVRHRLFDVKLAVVRSATYSLVLVTLAGVYFVIAFIFSALFNNKLTTPSQIISSVIISLALAFAFQPLKRFFDRITNKLFYKDYYNSDDFFARLNATLGLTTDLRNLLERAAYEIGHTLKSEQAFFFINTFDGHYVSAGTAHHKKLPKNDADQIEAAYNVNDGIINASLLDVKDPIRRLMLSHRIELLLPLIHNNEFIGHLCLGEHLNSGYTSRDMKVLDAISDGLIIAIKNALAVQEIKELNETLQQRISNATKELRASNAMLRQLDEAKDEFVSMASHQLRTPLTSIKGYISMLIEGDAGHISDAQRHFLDEAFMSSERMVHLINDFLNLSRIQTGKFILDKRPVNLAKVVGQEIDGLQPIAQSRKLKYIYHPPKNFPTINIDEGKIRQVIMNYADNALYYSHEGKSILVNLSIDKNEVLFTVKDHGIGVPTNERTHLFSKFYRASNAKKQRPDGTGVGLYLAKQIVDAHNGKIVFESSVGKGSVFGFRLPID